MLQSFSLLHLVTSTQLSSDIDFNRGLAGRTGEETGLVVWWGFQDQARVHIPGGILDGSGNIYKAAAAATLYTPSAAFRIKNESGSHVL